MYFVNAHNTGHRRAYQDLYHHTKNPLFFGGRTGNLNGHAGKNQTSFEREHGGVWHGRKNTEGHRILSFAQAYNLVVLTDILVV